MNRFLGIALLGLLFGCAEPVEQDLPISSTQIVVEEAGNGVAVAEMDSVLIMHDSIAIVSQPIASQMYNLSIHVNRNGDWHEIHRSDSLFCFNGFYPDTIDINGDGYADISIFSTTGARGGNSFAYVYLFKPLMGRFTFLKNSDFEPNLIYNEKKQLVESLGYDAAIHYTWFKITNDSMVPVERLDHELVELKKGNFVKDSYYLIDSLGIPKLVRTDSVKVGDRQTEYDIVPDIVARRY